MDRRKFFAFLPVAPFAAIAAAEAMAKAPPASMAPDKALMTLAAHKPPPPPPVKTLRPVWNEFSMSIPKEYVDSYCVSSFPVSNKLTIGKGMEIEADHNFDTETQVAMSVGKDGHLWLKINDEWKRIVTE
jgi:hypothetical protein